MTTPEQRMDRLDEAREDFGMRIDRLEQFRTRIEGRDKLVLAAAIIQTFAVVTGLVILVVQKVMK